MGNSKNDRNKNSIELRPSNSSIPEMFNNHFLRCGCNLNLDENSFLQYLHNSPDYLFYLSPGNCDDVQEYLKLLKPSAPGYGNIPSKVLKHVSALIALMC